MIRKVSVYIATTVDGFIARKNGSIDWLEEAQSFSPEGEDYGYKEFFDSIDTLVIGRKTYETVLSFDAWPYHEKKVVVWSSILKELPKHLGPNVTLSSKEPSKLLDYLWSSGSHRIYLDGGKTIQSFLGENLVDELTITRIPIILGEGLPLFSKVETDINLLHISTRSYLNGFVQSTYKISYERS